jgi:hypothetical protein
MSQQSAAILEDLLRVNNLGSVLDSDSSKGCLTSLLLEQLAGITSDYGGRFQVDVRPEALAAEAERNPHKVRAFFQALRVTRSREMLVMVWRVLQGLSIRKVEMKYQELEEFSLLVVLARPGAEADYEEEYRSQNIMDARLLWYFGVGTVCEKPLFAGFSLG